MSRNTYRSQKLPHLHPPRATYSLLMPVIDAVPKAMLTKLNVERINALNEVSANKGVDWQLQYVQTQTEYDRRYDDLLRRHANQSHPLANAHAARIVVDKLRQYDEQHYDLCSYSVMSNHVHAELDFSIQMPDLSAYTPLHKVVQLIKGGSAHAINKLNETKGQSFWPKRYRDRFIRSERHMHTAWRYTLNNPVAARLVSRFEDHPFTGGMTLEELDARIDRRVYPNTKEWYENLDAYDEGVRKSNVCGKFD